jgi:ComF family protein
VIPHSLRLHFSGDWHDWLLTLKNILLPMYCKICHSRLLTEENLFFCPRCWEASPRIERPFCSFCGKPHQGVAGLGEQSNFPCADCRGKPNLFVRRIWGCAQYADAISRAIRLFKFYDKETLAEPLAELMLEFAEKEMDPEAYDCLVPVPLYPSRERERGYNQALLLTEGIAGFFTTAQLDLSLYRIRPTRAQSSLKSAERAENVRGAFAVRGDSLEGKRVLLIDDVITTGGTVTECARAMKRAGALEVDAFAPALAFATIRLDR